MEKWTVLGGGIGVKRIGESGLGKSYPYALIQGERYGGV